MKSFDKWWKNKGSSMTPLYHHNSSEHRERVAEQAYQAGALEKEIEMLQFFQWVLDNKKEPIIITEAYAQWKEKP
jgi:hypothetical protein